jgi:predicted permease
MRIVAALRSLWRNVARRTRAESALDEELHAYVDLLTAEYERAGMTPAAARRAALVETGGIEQVKEATRDAWLGNVFATGARELRYALRTLRRSPAFLFIAIATLAIGIGGATAVFTVIKASLLRALPGVAEPDRLVSIERTQRERTIAEFSYPDFRDLRASATSLAGLAAYNGTSMALEDSAGATRAWVSYVSNDFFTVLGVRPAVGRLFGGDDDRADASEVVVLSHKLWQGRFGGSLGAIGSTLRLNGHVLTIIGVAPPGFIGGMERYPMELWIPFTTAYAQSASLFSPFDLESRRFGLFRLIGRLAPGKRVEDVQAELGATAARLAATYPTNRERGVRVFAGAGMTAEERVEAIRLPRLLAMAVALLLLIACGNVASLSLVRAAARRRELATRLALGASRGVLVRQVALEGALIAAGAGLLGIVVAQQLVRSATIVGTVVSMPDVDLTIDVRVLAVALAASGLTAILVSLMPAMQVFRLPVGAVLKDGSGGAVRRSTGGQRVLVAAQVAASLVLLSGAAIIFGAFHRVLAAHDGFDPRGLTYVALRPAVTIKDTTRQLAFYRDVLPRVAADPEIDGAALTSTIPPFQWAERANVFRRGEEPPPSALLGHEADLGLRVDAVDVSGDFFAVMRIPLLRGRTFTVSDDRRSDPVVIVSRRLADALWPGQEAVGQSMAWPAPEGPPRPILRVVGVAADTRDVSLTAAPPLAMYTPFAQRPGDNLTLIVRGRVGLPVSTKTVRRLVAAVDPSVAALGGGTLFERLQSEMQPQRTASAWVGAFGVIALLLAAIGLYGVVAQGVLQRTRELAVRAALGATPGGIRATVLGDGMRLAALGAVAGALAAIGGFQLLRSLFSEVQTVDLRLAVPAAAVLAVAMLAATYVPAWRASKLNPVDALRSD